MVQRISPFASSSSTSSKPGPNRWDYELDPSYIHHGDHTYSDRFTDQLPELLGISPRLGPASIDQIHEDIAFEAQRLREETILRLVKHWQNETGLNTLCIAGGVGLNIKVNSRIHRTQMFDHISPFPIPNDSGTSIGSAVGVFVSETGNRPEVVDHVYLGPGYTDEQIETEIRACGYDYEVCEDIADTTARALSEGMVVGWFQGQLEGGSRALGGRSILADPRSVEARDRVNSAIKFREYWRPFCPSLTVESVGRFVNQAEAAPFMILAFEAAADS